MTNLDAIKARLKGLLAIAKDDAASENEIQSALRIAARMMESHHLSEEDLQESEQDQFAEARNAERGRANAYVGRKVCAWEGFLAAFVRDFVGGIGVYKDHTVGRTPAGLVMNGGEPLGTITFYGILEDCQLATEVYNELRIVITAMASLRYGRVQKGDGAAYSEGFVAGLQANRKTDAAKLLTHNTSTGMILAKRRNELVRLKTDLATDWLKTETKVKLSAGRRGGSTSGSYEARLTGLQDGQKYEVTKATTRKLN